MMRFLQIKIHLLFVTRRQSLECVEHISLNTTTTQKHGMLSNIKILCLRRYIAMIYISLISGRVKLLSMVVVAGTKTTLRR